MAEYLNRVEVPIRTVKIEANFKEKIIVLDGTVAAAVTEEVWDGVVIPGLTSYWHDPGKDEIEYFIYYDDGSYVCQKRRLRMDPQTEAYYWKSYAFADASLEEAETVYSVLSAVHTLQKAERRNKWIEESRQLFDRQIYYEAKWRKYRAQISQMLLYSDFRMLPDYEENFPGEQQMWVTWRKELRKVLPKYETFETPYAAFMHISTMKYPIDPTFYFEKYPEGKDVDGNPVEYLSTEDQYDKLDFKASSDFVAANVANIADFVNNYIESEIFVTTKVYDLIGQLEMFKFFPELDSSLVKPQPAAPPEDNPDPLIDFYD